MCVLLVGFRVLPGVPVIVAANRDEAYARPATVPERVRAGDAWALAPRDLQAGGTWEGATERGLAVVVTNRRDGDFDVSRPSRGQLCRATLALRDARAVRLFVEGETRRRRYNSFNLFFADSARAFVASWNGSLETTELAPGAHTLSNEHALGELVLPELSGVDWRAPTLEALRSRLVEALSSHTPYGGFTVCKHGEMHGTVSASLITVVTPEVDSIGRRVLLEHAPGPPCRTPFVAYDLPFLPPD